MKLLFSIILILILNNTYSQILTIKVNDENISISSSNDSKVKEKRYKLKKGCGYRSFNFQGEKTFLIINDSIMLSNFMDTLTTEVNRPKDASASSEAALVYFLTNERGKVLESGMYKPTRDTYLNSQLTKFIGSQRFINVKKNKCEKGKHQYLIIFLISFADYRFG